MPFRVLSVVAVVCLATPVCAQGMGGMDMGSMPGMVMPPAAKPVPAKPPKKTKTNPAPVQTAPQGENH